MAKGNFADADAVSVYEQFLIRAKKLGRHGLKEGVGMRLSLASAKITPASVSSSEGGLAQ